MIFYMKKHCILLLLILASCSHCALFAQQNLGFQRYDQVSVYNSNGVEMNFPWTGGLNAVQFNTMDINGDGLGDLICFDRLGDRLLTFINESSSWQYRPEYQKVFPEIHHWIILRDFDADGDKDLFTYTTGGIKVFRNDGMETPEFNLITDPYLTSLQGSIQTNILVTYADYPGIMDLDYDGDLDILTFWGLGSFVEMHTNMSMERYGNADSLVFEKTTFCWGHFAESEESNELFMDTCAVGGYIPGVPKHTGSTFLLFDYDDDHDYDLLLGDVDYPTLAFLENGGDSNEAYMVSQTLNYPSSHPVFLYSFPAAFLEDVDFDGKKDLLVTPFDPSPDHAAVSNQILFYKNISQDNTYDFQYQCDDFLQKDMIDLGAGANPVFSDWNNDGLLDLLVGNEGVKDTCYMDAYYTLHCKYAASLCLYLNTGDSQNPVFTLSDDDFGGLRALQKQGFYPAVGDIDNDGDPDIVCGTSEGEFLFLNNNGGFPPDFVVVHDAFNAVTPGKSSAPALLDIDQDGDLDIISGSRDGRLAWFENTSSGAEISFDLVTETLGGVDVRDLNVSYYGYSTPSFFTTSQGETMLAVGSNSGRIYLYGDVINNTTTDFELITGFMHYIDPGERSACAFAELNGDQYPELVVGNYSGGMDFYKGIWPPSGVDEKERVPDFKVYPNPASNEFVVEILEDNHEYIISFLNIYGEVVKQCSIIDPVTRLNVVNMENGIYFLYLFKNNDTELLNVQKIVILNK